MGEVVDRVGDRNGDESRDEGDGCPAAVGRDNVRDVAEDDYRDCGADHQVCGEYGEERDGVDVGYEVFHAHGIDGPQECSEYEEHGGAGQGEVERGCATSEDNADADEAEDSADDVFRVANDAAFFVKDDEAQDDDEDDADFYDELRYDGGRAVAGDDRARKHDDVETCEREQAFGDLECLGEACAVKDKGVREEGYDRSDVANERESLRVAGVFEQADCDRAD
ncbi:MAG: hypothetical protein VCB26_13805 [Candidatus Hydrogenedentota bacterium]